MIYSDILPSDFDDRRTISGASDSLPSSRPAWVRDVCSLIEVFSVCRLLHELKRSEHLQAKLRTFRYVFVGNRSIVGSPSMKMPEQRQHMPDCESCCSQPPDTFSGFSNTLAASLYFNDGNRSIDFVLVWQPNENEETEELNRIKRNIFEENLINEGLEIEHESYENLTFVKFHATLEVLRRYAEILKLRMPMKQVMPIRTQCNRTLFQANAKQRKISFCSHFARLTRKIVSVVSRMLHCTFHIRSDASISATFALEALANRLFVLLCILIWVEFICFRFAFFIVSKIPLSFTIAEKSFPIRVHWLKVFDFSAAGLQRGPRCNSFDLFAY